MPTRTIAKSSPEPIPPDLPEVEVLRGVELPKMSPKRRHGRLQLVLGEMLDTWAGDDGEVASEWRFWLERGPESEETTLVPDLAFVSRDRMAALSEEEAEEPPFAPDVAIEIRSPGDRERNIRRKTDLYLGAGARLVLDVDPMRRRIVAYDRHGERVFDDTMKFEHPELPGFSFLVAELLARAARKR